MAAVTAHAPPCPLQRCASEILFSGTTTLEKSTSVPPGISFRRRPFPVIAAGPIQRDDSGSSRARAVELNRIFDQSPSSDVQFVRGSQSLPKPLSASDSSSAVSGSRLQVAYQGLPGAYSESAAAKAYPNCEAVPCEQFETAFDSKSFSCMLLKEAEEELGTYEEN